MPVIVSTKSSTTSATQQVRQSYFAPSRKGRECPYFIHATPEEKKA